jgi:hypothetical protein
MRVIVTLACIVLVPTGRSVVGISKKAAVSN